MTKPCECSEYNPACMRPGVPMEHYGIRGFELCSGRCPPERPCPENAGDKLREQWDAATSAGPKAPAPAAVTVVLQMVSALEQELEAWSAAGKPVCDAVELALRLSACHACPLYEQGKCTACGCALEKAPFLARAYGVMTGRGDVPGKAEMRTAACPKGKWAPLTN